jgi:hypothetical protein
MKIIKKCPKCGGEVLYLSEIHLIDDTKTGFQGNCEDCNTEIYHKFKLFEIEIVEYDENMEEIDKKIIKE